MGRKGWFVLKVKGWKMFESNNHAKTVYCCLTMLVPYSPPPGKLQRCFPVGEHPQLLEVLPVLPKPQVHLPPHCPALQYRKVWLIPALHTLQHWKPPQYLAELLLLHLTREWSRRVLVIGPVLTATLTQYHWYLPVEHNQMAQSHFPQTAL